MPNTNFQTIHQMGQAINEVVRQATGRDAVQNIDMDYVTVAQKSRLVPGDGYSGNPITFNAPKKGQLVDIILGMVPKQNLNGYGYAWPPGCGVNKFNIAAMSPYTGVYGFSISIDGDWFVLSGTYTREQASANFRFAQTTDGSAMPVTNFKPFPDDNSAQYIAASAPVYPGDNNTTLAIKLVRLTMGETYNIRFRVVGYEGGTAPTAYTPLTNICPVTGRDDVTVTVNGLDYTTDLPQTVYGGLLNMATGELTITWKSIRVGDVDWTYQSNPARFFYVPDDAYFNDGARTTKFYCSDYKSVDDGSEADDFCIYASATHRIYIRDSRYTNAGLFKQECADVQIAYRLEEPITLTVPKQMIDTLAGDNTISTDADSMEVSVYYYEDV